MEPESGGERPADQLQGFALQDQAIRPVAPGPRIILEAPDKISSAALGTIYKVVIRFEDHAIRGYAHASELGSVEQLLRNDPQYPLASIRLRLLDSDEVQDVATGNAKAIFFVKTFDGDLRHRALHFHEHAPIMQGLWVRVRFHDAEVIEGIISNTHDHVLGDGFFMMPTDPNGNNKLIYVLKSHLKDFHVLGIRNAPKTPVL